LQEIQRFSNVGIYELRAYKREQSNYAGYDANHPVPLTVEAPPSPCRIRDYNRKYWPNDKENQEL
jgi:hypothetical protein